MDSEIIKEEKIASYFCLPATLKEQMGDDILSLLNSLSLRDHVPHVGESDIRIQWVDAVQLLQKLEVQENNIFAEETDLLKKSGDYGWWERLLLLFGQEEAERKRCAAEKADSQLKKNNYLMLQGRRCRTLIAEAIVNAAGPSAAGSVASDSQPGSFWQKLKYYFGIKFIQPVIKGFLSINGIHAMLALLPHMLTFPANIIIYAPLVLFTGLLYLQNDAKMLRKAFGLNDGKIKRDDLVNTHLDEIRATKKLNLWLHKSIDGMIEEAKNHRVAKEQLDVYQNFCGIASHCNRSLQLLMNKKYSSNRGYQEKPAQKFLRRMTSLVCGVLAGSGVYFSTISALALFGASFVVTAGVASIAVAATLYAFYIWRSDAMSDSFDPLKRQYNQVRKKLGRWTEKTASNVSFESKLGTVQKLCEQRAEIASLKKLSAQEQKGKLQSRRNSLVCIRERLRLKNTGSRIPAEKYSALRKEHYPLRDNHDERQPVVSFSFAQQQVKEVQTNPENFADDDRMTAIRAVPG